MKDTLRKTETHTKHREESFDKRASPPPHVVFPLFPLVSSVSSFLSFLLVSAPFLLRTARITD